MDKIQLLMDDWKQRASSLKCQEVVNALISLGFKVKARKTPGHKTYSHPKLKDWSGGSFNCGHGRNPEVLSSYVSNILSVLGRFHTDLLRLQD